MGEPDTNNVSKPMPLGSMLYYMILLSLLTLRYLRKLSVNPADHEIF